MKASHEYDPELRRVYLEVVDNQLRDNNPPETRVTFDRLRSEGFNETEAKVLIASAIAFETFQVMKSGAPFNHDRFVHNLNRLPDQTFEDK